MIFESDSGGHKAERATPPCPLYRSPDKRFCLPRGDGLASSDTLKVDPNQAKSRRQKQDAVVESAPPIESVWRFETPGIITLGGTTSCRTAVSLPHKRPLSRP